MVRSRRMRKVRRSAFTLLEVLVVVGIIALLAAFVVPSFMNTQEKAKIDICRAMVDSGGQLAGQIQLFRLHVGRFPEELKELVEKPDDEDVAAKWGGPYIESVEKLKDPWLRELQYKSPGEVNTESYDLWSMGPDGEDGSDDDITSWTKS